MTLAVISLFMGGEGEKKQTKQPKTKQGCLSVKLVILLYSPTVQMGGVGWVGGWGRGGYGMARLGFLGGGGGMSSASGSAGRLRFWACWAAVQRSTYSRRISLVTGLWMLSHTPGKQTQTHRGGGGVGNKHVSSDTITDCLNKADQGEMLL